MLSREIDNFEIQLNNPTATYAPGDKILGKLILTLHSRKSLRALKLRFKGKCEVSWSESRDTGSNSKTNYYRGTENYFQTDICLVGATDGETIEMAPGHYFYPFSYDLPRNIPSSFKHRIGNICYSIEGIFDRAWNIDFRVKKIITVKAPSEWEPLSQHDDSAIDDKVMKNFRCYVIPCLNLGRMLMKIQVPHSIFECGDRIEATIKLNNKSNVNVSKIQLKFEQVLNFHSMSPEKTKSIINTIKKVKALSPFTSNIEIKLSLQVPQLSFFLFKYCKLIDLNYRLSISVHYSGCHRVTEKIYNILIGSRSPMPAVSCQQMSLSPITNYSTSTAPQVPINQRHYFTRLSPRIPIEYINSPYPSPVFSGLYPLENIQSSGIEFVRPQQRSGQDNWDESLPPSYEVAMAYNRKNFK